MHLGNLEGREYRVHWRDLLNTVMKLGVPQTPENS
jgi:hypothetical protein